MPPPVFEIRIDETPAALITPKNPSSAVPPAKLASAIETGPITPSDTPPGPKASNDVVPAPSVHTMPTCVGSPPGAAGLKVKVMPAAPLPEKNDQPATP